MEAEAKARFMAEIVMPRHPYFFFLDDFRPVRDPYFGERIESFKNGRLCKTYTKATERRPLQLLLN
jgi:hypothetical protein